MGLRAMAQTIGSTMSLYMISPEMTGTTILLLPAIIGVGTFLGSFLRSMSKQAQQQVNQKRLRHGRIEIYVSTPIEPIF